MLSCTGTPEQKGWPPLAASCNRGSWCCNARRCSIARHEEQASRVIKGSAVMRALRDRGWFEDKLETEAWREQIRPVLNCLQDNRWAGWPHYLFAFTTTKYGYGNWRCFRTGPVLTLYTISYPCFRASDPGRCSIRLPNRVARTLPPCDSITRRDKAIPFLLLYFFPISDAILS